MLGMLVPCPNAQVGDGIDGEAEGRRVVLALAFINFHSYVRFPPTHTHTPHHSSSPPSSILYPQGAVGDHRDQLVLAPFVPDTLPVVPLAEPGAAAAGGSGSSGGHVAVPPAPPPSAPLSSAPPSSVLTEFRFLGGLMAMALRNGVLLPLSLPALLWRPLAGLHVRAGDLATVDTAMAAALDRVMAVPEDFGAAVAGGGEAAAASAGESACGRAGGSTLPRHALLPLPPLRRQTTLRPRPWLSSSCASRHSPRWSASDPLRRATPTQPRALSTSRTGECWRMGGWKAWSSGKGRCRRWAGHGA